MAYDVRIYICVVFCMRLRSQLEHHVIHFEIA